MIHSGRSVYKISLRIIIKHYACIIVFTTLQVGREEWIRDHAERKWNDFFTWCFFFCRWADAIRTLTLYLARDALAHRLLYRVLLVILYAFVGINHAAIFIYFILVFLFFFLSPSTPYRRLPNLPYESRRYNHRRTL